MAQKKLFLKPVSLLVASLLTTTVATDAFSKDVVETAKANSVLQASLESSKNREKSDAAEIEPSLVLVPSDNEDMQQMGHHSHSSHSSHASHRSHYSGY